MKRTQVTARRQRSRRACSSLRRLALVSALTGLSLAAALSGGGRQAFAHAGYESSTPADGEVVAESPAQVEIVFGQEVARQGGLPAVTVVNQAGDIIAGEAVLSDEDRTIVTIALPPSLGDGRYTVIWHTLSDEDGEEAQGAFHFYVGEGPSGGPSGTGTAPAASPTVAPTQVITNGSRDDDDSGGIPLWAVAGVAVVGLLAGVSGGLILGGSRPRL
jgi:methionine-rich copper-binding protein CopC